MKSPAAYADIIRYRFNPLEKSKLWLWKLIRTVMIVGFCFIILFPLFLRLSVAFRSKADIYDPTVLWIPRHFTLDNVKIAMQATDYFTALLNTFLISAGTTIIQLASCALAAYAFARLKFKGSGLLFGIVIFTIVVPPQTIMIPLYLTYRYFDLFGLVKLFTGKSSFNLIDTFWPFLISSATAMGLKNGLYIYIFRQFFRGIPKEIEEAALVDGAGVLKTFYRIMLPNAVPAIVTVLLFSFVWQWNDSYYVSLFLSKVKVLSTQLMDMGSALGKEPDLVYQSMLLNTGVLLLTAPLIILYLFVQRYFVESVERTGIVG
ncbi:MULTISPECIES: carbohydrate ABC transporter permease [Paenibacillus]|jgi:multiple sugar transport system permease protein|uniref:Transporter n=1 Tax=Paenibacillus azoreducens TaxID=116718 RepID=A0A919YH51_9BACL|nr:MULTISPECIES: carbohydrate ABC transporter permease [Paenibacillus]MBE9915425.1 carbohydrate ABC transporter permease [Paenibacillus donghaensis]GIO49130.1 transporter [Paenibacillus azoreducens]